MKIKILVVDDNQEALKANIRLLSREGYEVEGASLGLDGLEMVKTFKPDLILLDVNLPDINGKELCKQIKADNNFPVMIILLSSESTSSFEQSTGLDLGADGYIARPVSNRELLSRVNALIRIKKAEDALRVSEWRYRTIVESVSYIICNISAGDKKIIYLNQAFERILGWKASDWIGQPFTELIHPDDKNTFEVLSKNFSSGQVVELHLNNAYCNDMIGEFSFQPGFADGKTEEIVVIIRDITEKKMVEEILMERTSELSKSNRELQQFAFMASHDLKEPLRMISSYLNILEMDYSDKLDDAGKNYIKIAVNGSQRMGRLIEDLLNYASITKEKEKPLTNLEKSLEEAVSNLKSSVEESGAIITYDKMPVLHVIPSQMTQLFQNLIGNAIKYRKDNTPPEIFIGASIKNEIWTFCVKDNGIGIKPEYKDSIFDLFQRLHRGEKYAGTGIGLAICKKIVEINQGRIWAESVPEEGSTFYFTLPAE